MQFFLDSIPLRFKFQVENAIENMRKNPSEMSYLWTKLFTFFAMCILQFFNHILESIWELFFASRIEIIVHDLFGELYKNNFPNMFLLK